MKGFIKNSFFVVFCLCAVAANAGDVSVRISPDKIGVGDDFVLQVSYEESLKGSESVTVSLKEPDLSKDFYVRSTNQKSFTNVENGEGKVVSNWYYVLSPKKDGELVIPSFDISGSKTDEIKLNVSKERVGEKSEELKKLTAEQRIAKEEMQKNIDRMEKEMEDMRKNMEQMFSNMSRTFLPVFNEYAKGANMFVKEFNKSIENKLNEKGKVKEVKKEHVVEKKVSEEENSDKVNLKEITIVNSQQEGDRESDFNVKQSVDILVGLLLGVLIALVGMQIIRKQKDKRKK